jgi:DNA-binding NarL/FixJ family response regulator
MQHLPDIPKELLTFLNKKERECYELLQRGWAHRMIADRLYFEDKSAVSKMKARIIVKINKEFKN